MTDDPFLTEMASHLIPAGGKRLRPAFLIAAALCQRADGAEPDVVSEEMICGGVAVELVHLGSLYHDDVMDDADTRRGIEAVNRRWGNLNAILAGDFLLAKASELAASLGTDVAILLAATIGKLCEGQVRELQLIYSLDRTEPQYLAAISGKTAELYATACRIGAMVAGADAEQLQRMNDFGHNYGMAFQIVDDVLDLASTSDDLGKPVGNDLREGIYTLPVIRILAGGGSEADELRSMLTSADGGLIDEDTRGKAHKLVLASDEIESSVRTAEGYVSQAIDAISGLPDTPTSQSMRAAAGNLLSSLPDLVS